ncbi:F0F1 ATP synthase subunit delta [Propioniciclava tarda]|uniref:ATP synthase subunit delta n=1 Tax=Propioniciclava tarda TaxID=433330 RepID=A0A4Q9KKX4_PROTD|nr:F0F1 ATP synthase subunit delta [Propioniciclava tarda]TBT95152.1 F0F1 ATP synthase subunit delta [Propioniciclava tarda]SMO51404.1 ATP synthase F1 subcomplex delta subunit [Propioniciclava tarda]
MSANADARQNALDRVLDPAAATAAVGEELFAVADALSGSPSLRRALTDAGTAEEARVNVATSLFKGKVSDAALSVLLGAVKLAWSTTGSFVAAIERQGVRAVLEQARAAGQLDEVEDQLFKVGRAVDAHPELRVALGERQVPVAHRQQLIVDVLGRNALAATATLARRAVVARQRTFDLTLQSYLATAAELRNRGIATVETARPLSDDQASRLKTALSRQLGRDVTLNVIVNPAVLGGVRVSIGDEVIEGTVAGRLSDVRRQLS